MPKKVLSGTKDTIPVAWFRFQVPSPEILTLVEKQCGAVSLGPHSRNCVADFPDAVSLARGSIFNADLNRAFTVSGWATGATGGFTVTCMVALEHVDAGLCTELPETAHVPETVLHI